MCDNFFRKKLIVLLIVVDLDFIVDREYTKICEQIKNASAFL